MNEADNIVKSMRRPVLQEYEPTYIDDLADIIVSGMQEKPAQIKKPAKKRIIDTSKPPSPR